ncbi:MAG TPA: hypothetical protein GX529_07260 [Firmicutes bacterium]|nr:hypothetical protein [Candidatus Fermentithermobacillaceae bacterium]
MAGLFRKLDKMDDRILYVLIGLSVLLPLIKPMQLPLSPSSMSVDAFEAVDSMPAGSRIFLITEIGPTLSAELLPQLVAIHRHAMSKGLRIIYTPTSPVSSPFLVDIVDDWQQEYSYEYGKDVVILPFRAGDESLVVQIGQNFRGLYDEDYYEDDLEGMEIMQGISDIGDVDLVISLGGGELYRWVVRHIQAPKKLPTIIGCTAVMTTFVVPFYSSGQFVGIISGLGGSADYEFLANLPGAGVSGMDAQSLGHVVLLILILLGNISGLVLRRESV